MIRFIGLSSKLLYVCLILSGDGGQDTMQKTGLNGILVSGIMANVMNGVRYNSLSMSKYISVII